MRRRIGELRRILARRARGLAPEARPILHVAVGAAAAWLVATEVLGHSSPFFAPIAAVITLGLTAGERLRRAIEITIGVAIGIAIADALVLAIGPGAIALAVVTGLALIVVRLLGGGPLVASQAAVSAVLVATIDTPSAGFAFDRALDALAGSTTGLAVGTLLLPVDPVAMLRRALAPVFDQLAATQDALASALAEGDEDRAGEALRYARETEPALAALREAIQVAEEPGRVSTLASDQPESPYLEAAREAELAVRNTRVLARSAVRLVSLEGPPPPSLARATAELAAASAAARRGLEDDRERQEARDAAARAARTANAALGETATMPALHLVGQLRLTAFDLMRALGVPDAAALEAVRGEPGAETREHAHRRD